MARKVSMEDIKKMNEIYYSCHNYAETARQTGWSASTVKNYIDPHYNPIAEETIIRFNPDTDLPQFSTQIFKGIDNYGDLCVLSEDEKKEMQLLWREIVV